MSEVGTVTAERRGELIQVDPPGPTLVFDFNPETLDREPRKPRIADVPRPRRTTASEWEGQEPFRIRFELFLDRFPDGSIHDQYAMLEAFHAVHPSGGKTRPPPRLRLRYSGFSPTLYVLEELSWEHAPGNRRPDLAISRTTAKITLREWQTPDLVISPARAAQERPSESTASASTHTVRAGESLWVIASQHLGDGSRFTEIADLNNLRDPAVIQPGQRLRIPPR